MRYFILLFVTIENDMKINVVIDTGKSLSSSLKKIFALAWKMDKNLVIGYYGSAALSAITMLFTSFTLKYLVDNLITVQNASRTASVPFILIVVLGVRYIVSLIYSLTNWTFQQVYFDYLMRYKLQNYIGLKFYDKIAHLDIAHLEDSDTQNLITKVRDTMLWRLPDVLRNFSYFFTNIVSIIISIIVLLPFGWWIPIVIIIASIPLLYLRAKYGTVQWSIYSSGVPEGKKLWYFTWLLSTQTAIREMKIFKSSNALIQKFESTQNRLFDMNKVPVINYARILVFPPILETALLFFIAYTQLPFVLSGVMTVGSFTLLINMIDSLSGQTGAAVLNFGEMYTHSLFVDDFFKVQNLPRLIHEKKDPHVFALIKPPKIEFQNVTFSYPNSKPVLKNLSFVIEPGENIAFVGENGAGKSTIIKLICRFYDVTDGNILVNGVDIRDLKLSQWYEFLGTLFQDFVQYHFTVKENIALGNPDRRNDDAIIEAAKKSGAYDFIKDLPKKFDTQLGKDFVDGVELSIGQWQKLAIARAFYEEAPVLILDEPTSAIDAEAEFEIFNNLEKAYKDKTLILVSHRFSTVRNAHKIVVVEHGEIEEMGTHEELMKKNAKYAKMFLTQAKGYE